MGNTSERSRNDSTDAELEYNAEIRRFCELNRADQRKLTEKFKTEFCSLCKIVLEYTGRYDGFYKYLIPTSIIIDYLDDQNFKNDYRRIVYSHEKKKGNIGDEYLIVLSNLEHRINMFNKETAMMKEAMRKRKEEEEKQKRVSAEQMNDVLKLDARELASKLTASLAYTRDPNYKQVVHKEGKLRLPFKPTLQNV